MNLGIMRTASRKISARSVLVTQSPTGGSGSDEPAPTSPPISNETLWRQVKVLQLQPIPRTLTAMDSIILCAESAKKGDPIPWPQVEIDAQGLANNLRSKDASDQHTALGKGPLPSSIVTLLSIAYKDKIPDRPTKCASFELLRLAANLCMDHNVNRQHFLDAKFHETALSVIKIYTSPSSAFDMDDLKVAKTAVGALLNSCYGFAPASSYLISLEAPTSILTLSTTLYPPARWATTSQPTGSLDDLIALYQVKIGLADWTWRLLSAINDGAEKSTLGVESIKPLLSSLSGFILSQSSTLSPLVQHSESRNALIVADLESLEECASLLEALSEDSEGFRLAFANDEASLVSPILDFVEKGDYPDYWKLDGEEETKRREKTFDVCKAGVIKALISIAGETQSMDKLWEKGNTLVTRMVNWIRTNSSLDRDDLVIAGCLTLGNLARKDAYCEALLREPYSIAPVLVELLTPEADIKVKHAVTGLLKNLAQAGSNRKPLGQSGVLEQLVHARIWEEGCDMAETVQISAIGVAKNLCNGDVDNTLRLMGTQPTSATDQLVALIKRSDSVVVKSEGTRVLAYCVKSLWKKDVSSTGQPEFDSRRQAAMNSLLEPPATQTLANLLVTGQKHTILLNESTFALTLLASKSSGASGVLNALNASVTEPAAAISDEKEQPTSTTGASILRSIISNEGGKYPPEVRANASSLVGTLLRNLNQEKAMKDQFASSFAPVLKAVVDDNDTPEKLKQTAKWANDSI